MERICRATLTGVGVRWSKRIRLIPRGARPTGGPRCNICQRVGVRPKRCLGILKWG